MCNCPGKKAITTQKVFREGRGWVDVSTCIGAGCLQQQQGQETLDVAPPQNYNQQPRPSLKPLVAKRHNVIIS